MSIPSAEIAHGAVPEPYAKGSYRRAPRGVLRRVGDDSPETQDKPETPPQTPLRAGDTRSAASRNEEDGDARRASVDESAQPADRLLTMLRIGMKIASTTPPTTMPMKAISSGSIREVSALTWAFTWLS